MPELAVLVALFRRDEPEAVETAVRTLVVLDDVRSRTYLDLVYSVVGDLARVALEALMREGYEYKSDFAKKYVAEGRALGIEKGRADEARRALYAVLTARSVDVESARTAIEPCDEIASLEAWLVRAAVASTIDEVLLPKGGSPRKTGSKRTKR